MRFFKFILLFTSVSALALIASVFLYHKPRSLLIASEDLVIDLHPIPAGDAEYSLGSKFYLSPRISYKGGVVLSGPKDVFGGWSAISLAPDLAHLIAINDIGNWFETAVTWDSGKIVGIFGAKIGPVLDTKGSPVRDSGYGDLEAVDVGNEKVYIGFESFRSGIWVASRHEFPENRYSDAPVPSLIRNLPKGRGIEALARIVIPGTNRSAILVVAERSPMHDSNKTPAWLLTDDSNFALLNEFSLETPDGFDVSDAAYDASCGLFVLERKLSWGGRFYVRLLKLNLDVRSGDVNHTREILFDGDSSGVAIDNMEGLSVVPIRDGYCAIVMISDDNFLPFQKTVLLNFELRL